MFCTKCGKEVPSDAKVCPNCGAVVEEVNETPVVEAKPVEAPKKSKVLVLSIVLSVVGSVVSLFIPIIGYVLGAITIGSGVDAKKKNDPSATVAIILGVVCIVISLASNIIGAILISQ